MTRDTPADPGALAPEPGALGLDDPDARRERLLQGFRLARECTRCPQLVASRTQVVFGSGNADAALMLVGDSPTVREDEAGTPFGGAVGRLLDDLLESIGLRRGDVFLTHALKCRPPGNRDPHPAELERCRGHLEDQVGLVQPRVVCTLGNVATRALLGPAASVTESHGRAAVAEVGASAVYVIPLYHPAAALYTRTLLDTLRADVSRIPELLARPQLPQPEHEAAAEPESAPAEEDGPPDSQLGLF